MESKSAKKQNTNTYHKGGQERLSGDNVCNDYKMEVLKEIWNELELDEVWFE